MHSVLVRVFLRYCFTIVMCTFCWYRLPGPRLNHLETMVFPYRRIDDLLNSLQGAKVFSKIDLKFDYNQLRIAEEDVYRYISISNALWAL
jgi:hypothetical protein